MRVATPLTLLLVFFFASPTFARQPDAAPPVAEDTFDAAPLLAVGSTEWMATAGLAWGVALFHSIPGHDYVLQSLSWGRVLTNPIGPGPLRGRFEWALEIIPIYGQFAPYKTYGVGATPLVWRWNFEPRGRVATFAELAGGALWTRSAVPQQTTRANFTAHASYGVRYFIRANQAVVASYRFHHISNGNRLERNPGVNAHGVQVGWTVLRSRP